jgi:hypothetical protein
MKKDRKPYAIQITSQYADDRYNKESAKRKLRDMGASAMILKMYRYEDDAS